MTDSEKVFGTTGTTVAGGDPVTAGNQDQQVTRLAEFDLLVNTGREYFSLFLRAFALYFAAIGAIVKVFFDAPWGSDERVALFAFGLLLHVGAIVATALGSFWFRPMASRCKQVGGLLGIPDVYYPATVRTAYAFLILEMIFLVAWLGLLWRFM